MVLVATQVKRRRGTTAENDAFTGAEGEITVDLTKKTLRVHDGLTQGGTELAKSDLSNITSTGKEVCASLPMPSNTYIDVTPGASGTIYTFGANGLLCIGFQHPDDTSFINYGVDILDANDNFIWNIQGTRNLNNQTDGVFVLVNKDQKVRIYNRDYIINRLRFVYAVGEV